MNQERARRLLNITGWLYILFGASSLLMILIVRYHDTLVGILETEFIKKARGTVTANGRCELPEPGFEGELQGNVVIRDSDGDDVVRGKVTVVIGQRE